MVFLEKEFWFWYQKDQGINFGFLSYQLGDFGEMIDFFKVWFFYFKNGDDNFSWQGGGLGQVGKQRVECLVYSRFYWQV